MTADTARLPPLEDAQLDDAQRAVLEAIRARGGRLGGPYDAYIRDPAFMSLNQAMGDRIRSSALRAEVRHVVVLVTVRFWGAEFAWRNNAEAARRGGLSETVIDAIAKSLPHPEMSAAQAVAQEFTSALLRDHEVDDALFGRARSVFGEEELVSLVCTVGFFSMTSMTLRAFRILPK